VATVSVIILVTLTAYIVGGLLALARVPDPGTARGRLLELAGWPVVAVRAAVGRPPRPAHDQPEVAATAGKPITEPAAAPPDDDAPATEPVGEPDTEQRGDWDRFVRRLTAD
jgi:hypothetical protein